MDHGLKKCRDGVRCGHCSLCVIGNNTARHNAEILASQKQSFVDRLVSFRSYVYIHRRPIRIFILSEAIFVLIGVAIGVIDTLYKCGTDRCFLIDYGLNDAPIGTYSVPLRSYLIDQIKFWPVVLVFGLGGFVSIFLASRTKPINWRTISNFMRFFILLLGIPAIIALLAWAFSDLLK